MERAFFRNEDIKEETGVNYKEFEKRDKERQLIETWGLIDQSKYYKSHNIIKRIRNLE